MNRIRFSTLGLALLTFLSLTGFRACDPTPVPIGEDCAPSACGPALGTPAILCADGSTGGNTGHCLLSAAGTCGWEIRACPPPVACTPSDCEATPLAAPPPGSHYECATVAAMCEWVLVSDCDPTDCGPAPGTPTYICADGSTGGFTGRCIGSAAGTCGWEILDCPRGECTVDECGPMPGLPTFTCPDGSIGGLAGCSRRADGACGWDIRSCPTPTVCGGLIGAPCPTGQACILDAGLCLTSDAQGTCQVRPDVCTDEFAPVCGCDGNTYGNACDAAAAGQSIDHTGACAGTTICGGFVGATCPTGEQCVYDAGLCLTSDAQGTCQPTLTACPDVVIPVCGCDGTTYGNSCEATSRGVSIDHAGACGGFACGDALTCAAATDYCEILVGGIPGSVPSYACRPLPSSCGRIASCSTCFPSPGGASCSDDPTTGGVTYRIFAP